MNARGVYYDMVMRQAATSAQEGEEAGVMFTK